MVSRTSIREYFLNIHGLKSAIPIRNEKNKYPLLVDFSRFDLLNYEN